MLSGSLLIGGYSLVQEAREPLDFAFVELYARPEFWLRVRKERLRFHQPRMYFFAAPIFSQDTHHFPEDDTRTSAMHGIASLKSFLRNDPRVSV